MFYKNIFKYNKPVPEYEFEFNESFYSYNDYGSDKEILDLIVGKTFIIEVIGSNINIIGDIPVPLKVVHKFIEIFYQNQEITDSFKIWLRKTYPNAEVIYRILISNLGGILYD